VHGIFALSRQFLMIVERQNSETGKFDKRISLARNRDSQSI
jgi:hypothetical protein